MNELYEFTKVNSLADDQGRQLVYFVTDSGKSVWILNDGAGKPDAQFVHRAARERKVVFIAFDSKSGACRFAVPFNEDLVISMGASRNASSELEVTLMLRPSYLYLMISHPRFQALRGILEDAMAKKQLVWVGTFPGDSDILDVRLAPSS